MRSSSGPSQSVTAPCRRRGGTPRGALASSSTLAARGAGERGERRDPHAAVLDRPQAGDEAVDEEGRPDLAALDDGRAVLVREHATTIVVAQDEVVEAGEQARRRGGVAAGQRRARQVVELAAVLVAESP